MYTGRVVEAKKAMIRINCRYTQSASMKQGDMCHVGCRLVAVADLDLFTYQNISQQTEHQSDVRQSYIVMKRDKR